MLDEGRSSQPEEPGAPLGNVLTMQRKESCNVFPSYRWETEADCDHVLQKCDLDLLSLEHSWALKSETMSYVCAQEEEEGMSWLQTFPDRRWSGLVQKRMQISALQLPAERRGEYG